MFQKKWTRTSQRPRRRKRGRMHRTFLQVVEKMREKEAGRLGGKVALTHTNIGSSFNKMENNLQISTQL